jgi:hypothetical protein
VPDGWVLQGNILYVDTSINPFSDVSFGTPGRTAILQLAARGIIRGYEDGRFGPDDQTLRAQMAALISRAMGWDGESYNNGFTDQGVVDPDLWRNVGTLAHYNVAHGYGDGTYGPTDPVLRVQVIAFITRAMVAKGYWQLQADDPAIYKNVPGSSGHRQDISTYVHYAGGALGETPPASTFTDWDKPGTRLFFVQALWRALDQLLQNPAP